MVLPGAPRAPERRSNTGTRARSSRGAEAREAQEVELRIWGIWREHDDNAIRELMRQGYRGMEGRDFRAALRAFDQVVAIAPDFAEGWNARATLYFLMGRQEDSLADIKRTLALEPRHFGALSGRGLVYAAQEKWRPALESFEAALEGLIERAAPVAAAPARATLAEQALRASQAFEAYVRLQAEGRFGEAGR